MTESAFNNQLKSIIIRCNDIKAINKSEVGISNSMKRELYSDIEILRLNILDHMDYIVEKDSSSLQSISEMKCLLEEMDSLICSLSLNYVQRTKHWYDVLDVWLRLAAVWLCLITFASTVSLPLIALKNIDSLAISVGIPLPRYQVTTIVKQFIAQMVMRVSGISLSVEGLERSQLGQTPSIVFFSHASSMDAFILAATIPVRHFTLAKKELFLIPFFSWLLIAFGGIPIDRHDRKTAVRAIKLAAESASSGNDCIAIAPEGTRSVTGQLIAFKKGPFYLWEELRYPIVPLCIFGAFTLYPPGNQITLPGRVAVKYLEPIEPDPLSSREAVSRLVRRKMLTALRTCPPDVGRELFWSERLANLSVIAGLFAVDTVGLWLVSKVLQARGVGLSTGILGGLTVTGAITAFLYVFTVVHPGPLLPSRSEAKVGKTD